MDKTYKPYYTENIQKNITYLKIGQHVSGRQGLFLFMGKVLLSVVLTNSVYNQDLGNSDL